MSVKKIDLKKTLKRWYTASVTKPCFVDVPAFGCLMIDGTGDPNGQAFRDAVGSLYGAAYTLKFAMKKERGIDYPVMALEGLWNASDVSDFLTGNRDKWRWTIFTVLPDAVTRKDVASAVAEARKKGKIHGTAEVRFQRFAEGRAAQVMHRGPYSAEGPTIERLHSFVQEQGWRLRGSHHEIYLGDPRRAAPEKLRTIIRHPVQRAAARRT